MEVTVRYIFANQALDVVIIGKLKTDKSLTKG